MAERGLVSMKRPRRQDSAEPAMPHESAFSYGLVLRLENFELDALKMKPLPQVGQQFPIEALVKVVRVSESTSAENKGDRNVELQIVKMKIDKGTESEAKT